MIRIGYIFLCSFLIAYSVISPDTDKDRMRAYLLGFGLGGIVLLLAEDRR